MFGPSRVGFDLSLPGKSEFVIAPPFTVVGRRLAVVQYVEVHRKLAAGLRKLERPFAVDASRSPGKTRRYSN